MEKQLTFIDVLRDKLVPMQDMLSLLEKQIEYIDEDLKSGKRDKREENADRILRLKTLQEIDTLKKILHEKEQYYMKYAKQFELDLAEANENWDKVIKKAWIAAKKNSALMNLMKQANFDEAKTNDESKVIIYTKLKKFI
jgi:hypothetical protein